MARAGAGAGKATRNARHAERAYDRSAARDGERQSSGTRRLAYDAMKAHQSAARAHALAGNHAEAQDHLNRAKSAARFAHHDPEHVQRIHDSATRHARERAARTPKPAKEHTPAAKRTAKPAAPAPAPKPNRPSPRNRAAKKAKAAKHQDHPATVQHGTAPAKGSAVHGPPHVQQGRADHTSYSRNEGTSGRRASGQAVHAAPTPAAPKPARPTFGAASAHRAVPLHEQSHSNQLIHHITEHHAAMEESHAMAKQALNGGHPLQALAHLREARQHAKAAQQLTHHLQHGPPHMMQRGEKGGQFYMVAGHKIYAGHKE